MPRGILYVETRPDSVEGEAEYHKSYEAHIADILLLDGFVSARRLAPIDDDGPFVALYEIEADDLQAARSRLREASQSGQVSAPTNVQTDPPPVVRLLEQRSAHVPDSPAPS